MKIIFSILLLLFNIKSVYSQTPYMDTLKKQLVSNSLPDTQRVFLISDLAYSTAFIRTDSALLLAQDGMKLTRKIGFSKGEAYVNYAIGEIMWIAGNYSEANKLLLQTLKYAIATNDTIWQMRTYRALSANNRDQGNYEEALKYSYKALEITKVKKLLLMEDLYLCALEAGAVYVEMNNLDSALYYLRKAEFRNSADHSGYKGFKYLMMGQSYAKMGNDTLALKYYTLTINTLTGTNNYKDQAVAYNSIAKLYEKEGKVDSCIYYAKKGFDVAQNGSFRKGVYETSLFLSRIYEKKDATLSLKYLKLATAAKDSMFNLQKTTQQLNAQFNEQLQQQQATTDRINLQNKSRTSILLITLGFFLLIVVILYRNNQHKEKAKAAIEKAYDELKSTQAQLIQSEKMASLGQLTAGIAHEIQNPLNFVNNFSEINTELIEELKEEATNNKYEEVIAIANDIKDNEQKIIQHGKRADSIVKGMLQHSRASTGKKELTDLNALVDECVRLSYHGMRAKDKEFNATINTELDDNIGKINVVPQDISRVLINLLNNAFYTVNEKKAKLNGMYEPAVSICTKKLDGKMEIHVKDNGNGIPQNLVDKIFQPFFTTKPTGQGTGLGLSLSYDIIKAHGGEIKVESKEGEGSEFTIRLPIN